MATRQQPASVVDSEGARRADLAAIHIGKKALQWNDDEYRHILWTVCRARSSAELDFAGRKRFLAHMRACGFVNKPLGSAKRTPFDPRQRLIWSLWQQLADAGRVTERKLPGLDAWVKRQTGVDKMVWLNEHQQDLAIVSLKAWLRRKEGAADAA